MSQEPKWRCKSCKYRQCGKGDWLPNLCARIKGTQDYNDDDFALDEQLAFSADASGYRSDFEVTDDFGCVLWEQKDE